MGIELTSSIILVFLLGLIVGSFLNVVIDRVPRGESLLGRSHCDSCGKKLKWVHLIPVVSFFFQGRKCLYCNAPLSWYYPLGELLTACSFVYFYSFFEPQNLIQPLDVYYPIFFSSPSFLFSILSLILPACFVVILLTDVKYFIIPDAAQFVLFVTTFILFLVLEAPADFVVYRLFSAAMVMLPLLLIYLITKGKGMGFGDVKFTLVMGFMLGIRSGLMALYVAFIAGAIISLVSIVLRKNKMKSRIPFGPFLVFGTLIVLLYAQFVQDTISYFFSIR